MKNVARIRLGLQHLEMDCAYRFDMLVAHEHAFSEVKEQLDAEYPENSVEIFLELLRWIGLHIPSSFRGEILYSPEVRRAWEMVVERPKLHNLVEKIVRMKVVSNDDQLQNPYWWANFEWKYQMLYGQPVHPMWLKGKPYSIPRQIFDDELESTRRSSSNWETGWTPSAFDGGGSADCGDGGSSC